MFKIPTVSQLLYYDGVELDNNNVPVANLQIVDRGTLYLKEAVEDHIFLVSDDDEPVKKARHDEGNAFKGTLLSGGSSRLYATSDGASSPERIPSPGNTSKVCHRCTYANPADSSSIACEMCDTLFL